jgi:hypothetical protein
LDGLYVNNDGWRYEKNGDIQSSVLRDVALVVLWLRSLRLLMMMLLLPLLSRAFLF